MYYIYSLYKIIINALLGIVGQYRTFESTYSNVLENLISHNKEFDFDIIINTDDKNEDVIDYYNKEKKEVSLR